MAGATHEAEESARNFLSVGVREPDRCITCGIQMYVSERIRTGLTRMRIMTIR